MVNSSLSLPDAIAAVEASQVRLLTSDVFDTVVCRAAAQPRDLFRALARRLRDHGWLIDRVDDYSFAIGRRQAERLAREVAMVACGRPECTLEEIWERMPAIWWAKPPQPTTGIDAELAIEGESLRLHPGVAHLFAAARGRDVPIVLVSDTYLSVEQLRFVLEAAGLDLTGIEVVTSSSRRRSKLDGLLQEVIDARGGTDGALHVGDNPIADVEVAQRAGVRVCHVDVPEGDDAVASAHAPWQRLSSAVGSDGGRSAAVRETLVAGGDLAFDPSYQFGVGVAGPIMAGFAGWVSATAEQLGARTIHCLLREGGRIAELIDIVRPDGPPRVLVHASRWAIMRAAVIDGTPMELERALARRADLRAEHVTDAFGCDTAQVARVIGASVVPRTDRMAAYTALATDESLRAQIVAASTAQRRNVMAYLTRTMRLDDGPLVLCDIGWGGTIQEGLTAIVRDAGIDNEVIGLYALLSPPGENRAGGGARLFGYLPTIGAAGVSTPYAEEVIRHPEFLERINTPAIGTLLEFASDGTPITRADDHDVIGPSLRAAQQGVLDFCTTLADLVLGDPAHRDEWFHDQRFAAAALESLASIISAPDPRLAAALGTWQHDDVAGTAAEALSNASFQRWLPYANAVDAAEITMHDVFWVPGVASAAGSALAHQLAALADGAHPDVLCPPSATGTARIAVFEPGSSLAAAQTELVPRLGTAGWMLLQLNTPIAGLRSVRIDAGDADLLVDIGDVRITVGADGDETTLFDGVGALQAGTQWVHGRWLDASRAVVCAGGHLLVDVPAARGRTVQSVSVSIGLRTWLIDEQMRSQLMPCWRSWGSLPRRVLRRLVRR